MPSPSISSSTKAKLDSILEKAALELPGVFFTVSSSHSVLYSSRAGRVDVLKPAGQGNEVDENTVLCFFSTTKLLTSVAILQLIDRGLLALDTPVSPILHELATPLKIIVSVDPKTSLPVYGTSTKEITVATLLNQSSGFGAEFGPKVSAWKKQATVGAGFVNSCKIANLVNTPPCYPASSTFEYGNSAEWLGLLIQRLTGAPLEEYFQQNLFEPLGITDTTFYPHRNPEFKERVMPLRFWDAERAEFQPFTDQFDGLKLPRETEEIEYPVAGGGIYTSPNSYARILQSLLRDYTSPSSTPTPTPTLGLSPSSLESLFKGTLSESALPGLASAMERMSPQSKEWKAGDFDWTTGLCLWNERKTGEDGKPWGTLEGFCGWGGAGNTAMGIDPKAGIAIVWSSNFLPPNDTRAKQVALEMERVLYEGLGL